MVEFGTQDWLEEYERRINASPAYREAAATWEGAGAFVFEIPTEFPDEQG